jgi:hypothetical protein
MENIFADHDDDDDDNGGNRADQGISQKQASSQNSLCVSAGDTNLSCNNISNQNQKNTGDNALGQQDNDEGDHGDDDGGNRADQGISQKQASSQNSLCVLAFDTAFSCNNLNDLFQINFGKNILSQQDNDYDD